MCGNCDCAYITDDISGSFSLQHRDSVLLDMVGSGLLLIPGLCVQFLHRKNKPTIKKAHIYNVSVSKLHSYLNECINFRLVIDYIADVHSIGLGQFKARCVWRQVDGDLITIPDFLIFPLSERKIKKH